MANWGSLNQIVGAVSGAVRSVEKSIDKVIGVPDTPGSKPIQPVEVFSVEEVDQVITPTDSAQKEAATDLAGVSGHASLSAQNERKDPSEEISVEEFDSEFTNLTTASPPVDSVDNSQANQQISNQVTQEEAKASTLNSESGIHQEKTQSLSPDKPLSQDQQIQELQNMLRERERQIQALSSTNALLMDENIGLKTKVENMDAVQSGDSEAADLKAEFSKRLGDLERKLAQVKKERDELKKKNSTETVAVDNQLIEQKDSEIKQLRQEGLVHVLEVVNWKYLGEKLAVQQLKLESTIKALRSAKKESDATIQQLQDRVSNSENLLDQKISRLKELEEENKRLHENLANMKEVAEATNKQLEKRQRVADSQNQEVQDLKIALEKSWIEIAEFKKLQASQNAKSESLVTEKESKIREEYQSVLDQQAKEFKERETQLIQTIQELRVAVVKSNERQAWREDELNKEIQALKLRIQSAETRNAELASSIPESTRPLLRQIETLQATYQERTKLWEQLEANLTNQLKKAEEALLSATQKESQAVNQLSQMELRVQGLEGELSALRTSNARQIAQHELQQTRLDEKLAQVEKLKSELADITRLYKESQEEIHTLKENEGKLLNNLREIKQREETALKEKQALEKEKQEKEKFLSTLQMKRAPLEPVPVHPSHIMPSDKIQSTMKQKEGEISALQAQIASLESTRDVLQKELVSLTSKNETLSLEVKELKEVKTEIQEIHKRYNTALDLLGEKEEKLEEMKADFQDMKILYRSQISQLLETIENLKAQHLGK